MSVKRISRYCCSTQLYVCVGQMPSVKSLALILLNIVFKRINTDLLSNLMYILNPCHDGWGIAWRHRTCEFHCWFSLCLHWLCKPELQLTEGWWDGKHPDACFYALWDSCGKSAYQMIFLYLVSDIKYQLTKHSGLINWLCIRCH